MSYRTFFGLAVFHALGVTVAMAAPPSAPQASPYRLQSVIDPYRLVDPSKVESAAKVPAHLADKPFADLIDVAARNAGLEPELVHAVIAVESGYQPDAKSEKGAIGLMQVLPETAQRYGIRDPAKSVRENLKAGTLYLRDLMQLFNGQLDLVLAAYNAGEKVVLRYGMKIPPYLETQRYVPAVLAKYSEIRPPAAVPAETKVEYLPATRLNLSK